MLCTAGGIYDPLTGIEYKEVITLRPHLRLQREIQDWCCANKVPYEPRVWPSQEEQERRRQQTEEACQEQRGWSACGLAKTIWNFLFTRHPHPFDAYTHIS